MPRERLTCVRRAVGHPVDLVGVYRFDHARGEEYYLHRFYRRQRVRLGSGGGCTEWFELHAAEVGALHLWLSLASWVCDPETVRGIVEALEAMRAVPERQVSFYPLTLTRRQAKDYLTAIGAPASLLEKALRDGGIRPFGRGRGWRVRKSDVAALVHGDASNVLKGSHTMSREG